MTTKLFAASARDLAPFRQLRRAFTIIELLVVITIITIIVLVALPRFTAMLYAQEEQLAVNLLKVAMKTGRDAALRSAGDNDAAVVFFYRPANIQSAVGGRLVMLPCIKVGTFLDDPRRLSTNPVQNTTGVEGIQRDVFVAVDSAEPVVLPKGWTVRGYAPPNTMQDPQNNSPTAAGANWYEAGTGGVRYTADEGNWVFPETDFYSPVDDRAGNDRQSFMVRFKAGTGEIVSVPNDPVIVVDVRPSYDGRDANSTKRLWDSYDRGAFIAKILREAGPARQLILGRSSNDLTCSDTVLVRPVQQLALCDENKLAAALNVQVDRYSGCLYRPPPAVLAANDPPTASAVPAFINNVDSIRINQWIEGDTNFNDQVEGADGRDEPLARVFSIERYTGEPRQVEVQP